MILLRLCATAICLASLVFSSGCIPSCSPQSSGRQGELQVDGAAQELRLNATFHRTNAEEGTWHLLVHHSGTMASLAYFTTDVTPTLFYSRLRKLKFEDQDTIDCDAMGEAGAATEGDALEFLFQWPGVEEPLSLNELLVEVVPPLPDANERGLEMRFGGNHTDSQHTHPPSHRSGCLACLYTCCAGVTSNSRANLDLLRKEDGEHRYRVRPEIDLADGTQVQVIVRKKSE